MMQLQNLCVNGNLQATGNRATLIDRLLRSFGPRCKKTNGNMQATGNRATLIDRLLR